VESRSRPSIFHGDNGGQRRSGCGRTMLDAYCCSGEGDCVSRELPRQALSGWHRGMLYQTLSSHWVAGGDTRFRITISTRVALKDVGVFSALDLPREAG
jgi:hypothetical protein